MSRKLPGSAIVPGSITLTQIAGSLNDTTNAAYAQANTARNTANDAYGQANTAYGQANNARSDANTTFATINTTFGTVNTSLGTINTNYQAAYSQANTARDTGNNAYASANLAYTQANNARSDANTTFATVNTTFGTINTSLSTINSSFSSTNTNYQAAYAQANTARDTANNAYNNSNTKLSTSGGSISGDLAITGNLTVQGNATTINVTNLSVNDSMILLATGGAGDSNDIGFIGHIQRGATDTHVGLIRKATENRFYLFDNYEVEPTNNVIDVAGNNFRVGNLRLGIVNANSYVTSAGMDVTGQANAAYGQANAAYGQANNARSDANTTFATINTTFGTINTNATNINSNALNAYASANLAYAQANNARSDANTTFATVNTTFATINTTTATMNTATSNRVLKAGDTMTGQLNISSGGLLVTGNVNMDSGSLFVDSVNDRVGIGTTSPGYKLDVSGTLRSTGTAALGTSVAQGDPSSTDITANAYLLLNGVGGNYLSFGQKASNLCQWIQSGYQNPTTAVYPISLNPLGGNVGIGTISPSTKLDVEGSGAGGLLHINNTTAGKSAMVFQDNGSQKLIVGLAGIWEGNSSTDAAIATESGSNIRFYTNGSATERMRIDTSGNMYLGLTGNPAGWGSAIKYAIRQASGSAYTGFVSFASGNDHAIAVGHDGTKGMVGVSYATGSYTPLTFQTSGTDRITIATDGNVGIGTASPAGRLHVYGGDAVLYSGSAGNSPKLIFGGEYSSTDKSIYLESYFLVFKGHNNEGFKFITVNSSGTQFERLRVAGDGTVRPGADNSQSLGTASFRWSNLYTGDLHLSNKGKQNDVDGTWGDWTIQEGDDNLYVINNRSGKKFKIKLEEV